MKWIRTDIRLPALPDRDYCSVMVITAQEGISTTRPMIYERTMVRGKRKERWKYYWGRIAEELPDYWAPLPAPPWEEKGAGKTCK